MFARATLRAARGGCDKIIEAYRGAIEIDRLLLTAVRMAAAGGRDVVALVGTWPCSTI